MRIDLRREGTKWPLSVRLRRSLWQGFVSYFVRYLPRPFNGLRIVLLRLFGAKIGRHCLLMPGLNVLIPWNLEMEDTIAIGRDVEIYNHARVSIGAMTVISQYSFLCTSSHDYTKPAMPMTYAPIRIGSEVWIASDVFVGPGVTIGDGCVVGARSVVTRDMPEWMVCAGNPCRAIKARVVDE
jgi:putative colanic acid biosynthesis acetyltransferase WcaF